MKGFIMSTNFDQYHPDHVIAGTITLNIPAYVRAAVRQKLKKLDILFYLYLLKETPASTLKMKRFFPIAKENNLTRNEMLIWLHLSYGGSTKPKHISQKLRIPPRFVENALTVLQEKGIIEQKAAL